VTDIGGDFLALRGYLAGDLPADQMRAIEDRLECDPRLVRELELHLRMREGLEQVRTQRAHAMAAARRREIRSWSSGLAAAAGCAGLALLVWSHPGAPDSSLLLANPGPNARLAAAAPVTQFTFVAVRGPAMPELALPVSGLIELRAAPGHANDTVDYQVTLARRDAQGHTHALGTLTGVSVAGDGYLHTWVDAVHLTQGAYLLSVEPKAKVAGTGEVFEFRLHTPPH